MKWHVINECDECDCEKIIEAINESDLLEALLDEVNDFFSEKINELVDECPADYSNCSTLEEAEKRILSFVNDTVKSQYTDVYYACTPIDFDGAIVKIPMVDLILSRFEAYQEDSSSWDPLMGRFIERILCDYESNSHWHVTIKSKSGEIIESVTDWSKLADGKEMEDIWGKQFLPIVWFGPDGIDPNRKWILWDLSTKNIDSAWFSDDTWTAVQYLISDADDGFLIWYTAECFLGAPDMDSIRQNCPIKISKDDPSDVIMKKVTSYLVNFNNQHKH